MKKTFVMILLMVAACVTVNAQTLKVGRVNSGTILQSMPEFTAAQTKMKTQADLSQEQVDLMRSELEKKYAKWLKDTTPPAEKAQVEAEMQELQDKLQKYAESADASLKTLQQNLMTPIIDKINTAIQAVSKENGMTFVIDDAQQPFIYVDETAVRDLSDLVAKKLGITLTATPAAAAPAAN